LLLAALRGAQHAPQSAVDFVFLISVLLAALALVARFGAIGINVLRYLPHQLSSTPGVLRGLHDADGGQSGARPLA
jgi:hypothetical protein